MYKIFAFAALTVISMLTIASADKCDIMKEFKPDIDEIVEWAEKKCEERNNVLNDEDLTKAQGCYKDHLKPMFVSDNGKAVDGFVLEEIFGDDKKENMKKCCTDEKVQAGLKKAAMKKIGMKKGMECKKEIEADCPTFKKAMQSFNGCVRS